MKPIVNMADVELEQGGNGDAYVAKFGRIGPLIGAEKLGVMLHVVPAGKKAFPRHAHHVNEEMMVILEGEGTYRAGDETWPVRAGDVIAATPGDGSTAHHVINSSGADLRYLTISTREDPEIVEYPDSGKFGVFGGIPKAGGGMGASFRFLGRMDGMVDYYDGEE